MTSTTTRWLGGWSPLCGSGYVFPKRTTVNTGSSLRSIMSSLLCWGGFVLTTFWEFCYRRRDKEQFCGMKEGGELLQFMKRDVTALRDPQCYGYYARFSVVSRNKFFQEARCREQWLFMHFSSKEGNRGKIICFNCYTVVKYDILAYEGDKTNRVIIF